MYDVIVVGGGPSGASAAYELARSGAKVVLLERLKLPRYKACGGLIPWNFFKTLPERPQKTLEVSFTGGICKGPGQKELQVELPYKIAGVMRDRFDYEFVQSAVDEGATLIDENPVLDVKEASDRVVVRSRRGSFEGRFLIGADGATGIVRRSLGMGWQSRLAPALEVEIEMGRASLDRNHCIVDCAAVRDGYAWILPKGNLNSVGLASFRRDRKSVRQLLAQWIASSGHRLNGEVVHGHPIPIWGRHRNLATQRAVLVGDSAETVDPFLGEGIRYGVLSGRIAAEHMVKALVTGVVPPGYSQAIHGAIQNDFVYAKWMAAAFYQFPGFFFDLWVRSASGASLISRVLYGEICYKDLFQKAFQALMRPKSYHRLFSEQPRFS